MLPFISMFSLFLCPNSIITSIQLLTYAVTRKKEVLQATRGSMRQTRSRADNVSMDSELREIDNFPASSNYRGHGAGQGGGNKSIVSGNKGPRDYDSSSQYTGATYSSYAPSSSRAPSAASRQLPRGLQQPDPYRGRRPMTSSSAAIASPYSDMETDIDYSLKSDFKFDPRSRSSSKQTDVRSTPRRSRRGQRGQSPGRG